MTSPDDQLYLKEMAKLSVRGNPTEYEGYGVITEAFVLHKKPRERYTIFPQLRLRWNPELSADKRAQFPDFGIGRYNHFNVDPPSVYLMGGAEVKRPSPEMQNLPEANDIVQLESIQNEFHACFHQAEDQAKAAVKGHLLPNVADLRWLIFIGPYFSMISLGPFAEEALITRGHRFNPSGDFEETMKIEHQKQSQPEGYNIYLLGTPEAARILEIFINHTQQFLLHQHH